MKIVPEKKKTHKPSIKLEQEETSGTQSRSVPSVRKGKRIRREAQQQQQQQQHDG